VSAPPVPADRRLLVVGAGIMGSGVAAQAALAGWTVDLYDLDQHLIDRGMSAIHRDLETLRERGTLSSEDRDRALGRLRPTLSLQASGHAHVVVEAAPEQLALKRGIFQELDRHAGPDTLLASNTSSLSITALASATSRPARVVGIHFFNPVLRMRLVELIPGVRTDPGTLARARAFAEGLGKTVTVSQDAPGFVTSRAMAVLVNEAIWMLHDGVASREDIDQAHKLGFHHPMGPLELADLVGLDTLLAVLERLYTGFRDPKYRACPLLVNLVEAGRWGRKTGQGFYTYDAPGPQSPPAGSPSP
jgi:3-hydroxybutyryl-CoA dehydrogenase